MAVQRFQLLKVSNNGDYRMYIGGKVNCPLFEFQFLNEGSVSVFMIPLNTFPLNGLEDLTHSYPFVTHVVIKCLQILDEKILDEKYIYSQNQRFEDARDLLLLKLFDVDEED